MQRLLREMEIRFKKELRGGGEIKAQDNKETGEITAGRAKGSRHIIPGYADVFCSLYGIWAVGRNNAAVSRKKMVLTGNAAAYEEDGGRKGISGQHPF